MSDVQIWVTRDRELPIGGPRLVKGSWWWGLDGQTRFETAPIGTHIRTHDTIWNFDQDNYFLTVRDVHTPALMSGTDWSAGVMTRKLNAIPAGYFHVGFNPNELSGVVTPNWFDLAKHAVSAMNPNRAHINVGTFLGELKDLPEMVREIPEALRGLSWRRGTEATLSNAPGFKNGPPVARELKNASKAYLAWSFGWAPLLRDLRKMLDFGEGVQRRLNWLQTLAKGKSLYRSLKLPGQHPDTTFSDPFWAETWYANLQLEYTETRHVFEWCTSRWRAKFPTLNLLGGNQRHLQRARALAAGITPGSSVESVWALLPWSWLVDWFYDIGQHLSLLNNSLLLELESLCYMRKVTLLRQFRVVSKSSWVSVSSPGRFTRTRKERIPLLSFYAQPEAPSFNLPVLTKGQLSILFALFAQKDAIKNGTRASVVWR
jgi:hypothetical protein